AARRPRHAVLPWRASRRVSRSHPLQPLTLPEGSPFTATHPALSTLHAAANGHRGRQDPRVRRSRAPPRRARLSAYPVLLEQGAPGLRHEPAVAVVGLLARGVDADRGGELLVVRLDRQLARDVAAACDALDGERLEAGEAERRGGLAVLELQR